MATPCQNLESFVDGELDPSAAAAFRDHLLACGKCQAGLGELLQLGALADRYHQRAHAGQGATVVRPAVRAWRRSAMAWAGGALSLAAAAAIAWMVVVPGPAPDELWRPPDSGRLIEGRSSYPRARDHRPMKEATLGPGDSAATLPHELLGRLPSGQTGNFGRAAAYLVRGQLPDQALTELQPLGDSADVLSERALAHLVRAEADQGDYEEALRLTDAALEKEPRHGPALFNKALALRALGLDMVAMRTFEAVAELGEPGWSQEAKIKAEQLREAAERIQKQWFSILDAGAALLASGAQPPPALLDSPVWRAYFYEAVRSRTSAADVKSLLPLARQLDQRAGGTVLEDYAQAVARRDFSVRAPFARSYLQLATRRDALDDSRLAGSLLRSPEEDIVVGTLVRLQARPGGTRELPPFPRRELTAADPWFDALWLQSEANEAQRKDDLHTARQKLEEALLICRLPGLEYRCLDVQFSLTDVLVRSFALDDAHERALEAWRIARQINDWNKQVQLIQELAQFARLRNDFPLASAYHEEAIEQTQKYHDKPNELFARESLASAEAARLRWDAARKQIDAAIATGMPLTMTGAATLSDIARLRPEPGDEAAMEAFRAQIPGTMSPAERGLATHTLGRFVIEIRPSEGQKLLEDAIAQIKALPSGSDVFGVLPHSYTALILAAGKKGDFTSVWSRFEEQAGGALPKTCIVAAAVDGERTVVVIRSVSGAIDGAYDAARISPIAERVDGLLPSRLVASLEGCAEVQVVAGPPVYGRAGFLPRGIAWSYVLPRAKAAQDLAPEGGSRSHLLIKDVALADRRRRLPKIQSWAPADGSGGDSVILSGLAATPSAVLQRIQNASDIDIIAHGLVDPFSTEAYLVLAPDRDGDMLRASQIEAKVLRYRPIVVLASCSAAHTGPQLDEARSLPAAFLHAGARAVLAAASEIPERDGPAFFNAVRQRIDAGSTAARALRDERKSWIERGRGTDWLDNILLFE